jgi:hypothetical protein
MGEDHIGDVSVLSPDLLLVSLKQSDILLQTPAQPAHAAVPPTPAESQAVAQLVSQLRATTVDEVGRGYDFHQVLPAGLVGVAISRCAALCDPDTSVYRNAISTIMVDGQLQLEVAIAQRTLSRIDITARCVAGVHHDTCLRKLALFRRELFGVIKERWPGCTWTELCLSSVLGPHGVEMGTCEQALRRGEESVSSSAASAAGDTATVLLSALLGSKAVADAALEPGVRAQVATLHFFRALAAATTPTI